jgi:hypothetical protein
MSPSAAVIPGAVGRGLRRIVPVHYRPIGYLNHLAQRRTAGQVHAGPFAGMRYVDESVGSCFIPKLLGTYERELVREIEWICRRQPDLIIDIGAAEGYYAIGLALRIAHARVVAFEQDEAGQTALRAMAQLNGVSDRLTVRGRCEPEDLAAALAGHPAPVIVCDVEGYEQALLDPERVAGLNNAILLVETHEFLQPGVTEELCSRFACSHQVERIWQEPRNRAEFPWRTLGTMLLPVSYLDWAVSEWRPVRMSWLWMTPRSING